LFGTQQFCGLFNKVGSCCVSDSVVMYCECLCV